MMNYFPKLPIPSDQERKVILGQPSHGKAIEFNGISDCIFALKSKNKPAKVLNQLSQAAEDTLRTDITEQSTLQTTHEGDI